LKRILLVAALAAGCSSDPGPKPADPPRIDNAKRVRVLWSANVGSGEHFTFAPALSGGWIYAAARDGTSSFAKMLLTCRSTVFSLK